MVKVVNTEVGSFKSVLLGPDCEWDECHTADLVDTI
jgi:hypothetical protein